MEILCFKIKGKFAHFRKYYANNTAFSFTIPPRTSLMGIVAASIGWKRDSYYEKLSSGNIKFSVRVLSPLKKSFHRMNYLSIKALGDLSQNLSSDFRGEGGRIQTPFEIVTGLDINKDEVIYQIFITKGNKDEEIFDKIKEHFLNSKNVFNISLGSANFSANIYDVENIESEKIKILNSKDFIKMNSVIPIDNIEELEFEKDEYENYNFIEEDMMPADFVSDNNREVGKMNKLIFSITKNPIRVKLKNDYYQIQLIDESVNIQFMD